jgi:hypothetical protein
MSIQIQLGSKKKVNAVNVDEYVNIELKNSHKELLSFNESSLIDVSGLFNSERQTSQTYRVYGRIDFMSIINGLHTNYSALNDFFTPPRLGEETLGLTKNLTNCFDVYLCYPSTGNTIVSPETYIRNYTVVAKKTNVEIYKAGYSLNYYYNKLFAFDFNIDFNVDGLLDSFGKPLNYFYLFFNYVPSANGLSVSETVYRKTFVPSTVPLTYQTYNIGDTIIGDLVNYVNLDFEETLQEKMEYYVNFPYDIGTLQFSYNPFIPIKFRDYGDEIIYANATGGTEIDLNIPLYAIPIDNKGNYIWKDFLQNGYIDPISGKGVDFPFVNQRHYVFNTIVLPLKPNTNDTVFDTNDVFNNILFNTNTGVYTKPATQGSLNNLGNKCA